MPDSDQKESIEIFAVAVVAAVVVGLLICCVYSRSSKERVAVQRELDAFKDWLSTTEENSITGPNQVVGEVSKHFSARFFRLGKWHNIPHMFINRSREGDLSGQGQDEVGVFLLTGQTNLNNTKLSMRMQYEKGTGSPEENYGQKMELRLERKQEAWEGKWFVISNSFAGSGEFEMRETVGPAAQV